jgi:hypothetical protein
MRVPVPGDSSAVFSRLLRRRRKLQQGDRVRVTGGYDMEPQWLAHRPDGHVGTVQGFIEDSNGEPAAVIALDGEIALTSTAGEPLRGRFLLLTFAWTEMNWSTPGPASRQSARGRAHEISLRERTSESLGGITRVLGLRDVAIRPGSGEPGGSQALGLRARRHPKQEACPAVNCNQLCPTGGHRRLQFARSSTSEADASPRRSAPVPLRGRARLDRRSPHSRRNPSRLRGALIQLHLVVLVLAVLADD